MKPIHEQIKEKALPKMTAYYNDLNIDVNCILENKGIPFIHYTGSTGTNIEFLFPADSEAFPPKGKRIPYLFGTADRYHILNSKISMLRPLGEYRSELIQYFDGKKIRVITHERAVLITKVYVNNVLNLWNRN